MKFLPFSFWATLATLSVSPISAKSINNADLARIQNTFPENIEALYRQNDLKGDLLIAVVDSTGLRYSYTLNKNGANESSGLTTSTPFLIASHTKALTGTLAQILESQGRFDINAPIKTYLADNISDKRIATNDITIGQLLNHTAGFTSIQHTFKTAYLGFENSQDVNNALNLDTLVAPPGKFRYSNTGPILAATAMEKATGKSWKTLMHDEIFVPLGMNNTSAFISTYPENTILPTIETDKEGNVSRTGLFKTDNTLHASGGIVSNLADMSKWLQFNLLQSKQLSNKEDFFAQLHQATAEQDKRYFTYDRNGYSLAWDIADYHGKKLLTRFGGYAGVSFHASFMPEEQVAVVSFYNEERAFLLPHVAANLIYNLITSPENAQNRYAIELDSFNKTLQREMQHALDSSLRVNKLDDAYLGRYTAAQGWPEIKIFTKDNQIWLRWGEQQGPLYQNAKDNLFIAALGPISREISLAIVDGKAHLTNGSINYVKVAEQ